VISKASARPRLSRSQSHFRFLLLNKHRN